MTGINDAKKHTKPRFFVKAPRSGAFTKNLGFRKFAIALALDER
jgi:hypothetical protein